MSSSTPQTQTEASSAPRWDLESIFPGGSASRKFADFRKQVQLDLTALEDEASKRLVNDAGDAMRKAWTSFTVRLQNVSERTSEIESFAGCLISQDVTDDAAAAIVAESDLLMSRLKNLQTSLESYAGSIDDAAWKTFLADPAFAGIGYYLDQIRLRGREKMAPELEQLAEELSVNGYHAWNRLYDKMAGDLTVDFDGTDQSETISLGQLTMYLSNSRREIRKMAMDRLNEAWESRANLSAMALNAQGGFRLSLYRNRKWDGFLHEPLTSGHMKRETLDAMWAAVADGVKRLAPYIEAKKKHLDIKDFCWYDQEAPVGTSNRSFQFDEAGRFIVEQLADFSPEMADYTKMAIDKNWIEAENRAGKAGGGFCTGLPIQKETRIFMTWGNEYAHLLTLAHELGHAYHAWVLRDSPFWATHYPMNLAETASTFNELRVTDAALKASTDDGERLMLLDQKLQNGFTMFCNLRSRFLFDSAFYTERAKGVVPRARLDELMVNAQREAFGGILADPDGFHPLFWSSKLHFFITTQPFYNFPYVFGYLFANGVYSQALAEGSSFADRYRNLLLDTGSMSCEDVARKHLDADLTSKAFWDSAVDRIIADVEPFVEIAGRT